jgi:hypothetical protein
VEVEEDRGRTFDLVLDDERAQAEKRLLEVRQCSRRSRDDEPVFSRQLWLDPSLTPGKREVDLKTR